MSHDGQGAHDTLLNPHRRALVWQVLAGAALVHAAPWPALAAPIPGPLVVDNVTGLYPVSVARVATPASVQDVVDAVKGWPGPISIGGGRYSMGGQVALPGSLHLDLRALNQMVWLKPVERTVRVRAGMRWRDLQDRIDRHDLSVRTMQSYASFTVGGSVSVNAHGRYVGHGPVGHSVRALQLVLADGRVVEASRTDNAELFRAAIGGYGAMGVITEIELDLDANGRIERSVREVALDDYLAHFEKDVKADPDSLLHNADLLPPLFDRPVCVTWRRSLKPLTVSDRLTPRGQSYTLEQHMIWAMTELPGGALLRKGIVQPLGIRSGDVVWRNHEASLDVAELEPRTRALSTYALQEYFVPARHLVSFAKGMAQVLRQHDVAALNVSIRHSPADTVSMLPWAREAVFSFVLYHKQRVHARARDAVGRWTRELIELVLQHEGRYYLPYQLHATPQQFNRAYPEAESLRQAKRRWDPNGRFSNALWARYL